MTAQVIDGMAVIRQVPAGRGQGLPPRLATVLICDDPASKV